MQISKNLLPYLSSCTDLIFTDQANIVIDFGDHPNLNPSCHYHNTYLKLNLNIHYLPP